MSKSTGPADSILKSKLYELSEALAHVGRKQDGFAASLAVRQDRQVVHSMSVGRARVEGGGFEINDDTRFLVASLTKPVVAAAAVRCMEMYELPLTAKVCSVLPEFVGEGFDRIEIWHLLTHTSGLPDMVSDNLQLRERHAELPKFFRSICQSNLSFTPGSSVGYQSMGFLVLSTIVERVSGFAFDDFIRKEIFFPAGMNHSTLGAEVDAGVPVILPTGQVGTSWNWNSPYWRNLGAPWGGLLSTAKDLAAFAHLFVSDGLSPNGRRVLTEASIRLMSRDWTSSLGEGFPPLGLGWFVRGNGDIAQPGDVTIGDSTGVTTSADVVYDRRFFGSQFSENALGHCGVTGCVMWADPRGATAAALLTNMPSLLNGDFFGDIATIVAQPPR
jgi:CubicO group peptidase (beta-lactamase class C family)